MQDGAYVDETSTLKQRVAALNEENRALEARLQILHVKLDDRDMRVKESVLDTVNKDERLQQLQVRALCKILIVISTYPTTSRKS